MSLSLHAHNVYGVMILMTYARNRHIKLFQLHRWLNWELDVDSIVWQKNKMHWKITKFMVNSMRIVWTYLCI